MKIVATPHPLIVASPSVRLPVTICMLTYGANAKLAERFVTSLYATVDASLFQLRVGLNEVEDGTRKLFDDFALRFGNIQLFIEPQNRFKSPLMRRMFYDPSIGTEWVIWCDDDTHFVRADWFQRLCLKIEQHPTIDMWGMIHKLWRRDGTIQDWIQAASWYRNLPLVRGQDLDGNDAVEFVFATGGFWAIRTEILRQLDWPDPRLVQAHDDFLLGEALRQSNLTMGSFYSGVKINDAPRRNSKAAEVQKIELRP